MAQNDRLLRILLSAYCCAPNQGSEHRRGWNWAIELAKYHEVWVLTDTIYKSEILSEVQGQPRSNLHFIWVEVPTLIKRLSLLVGYLSHWVRYYAWQKAALQAAVKVHLDVPFDLSHHVSWSTWRVPCLLWKLGIPLVWGPIGGGQNRPKQFERIWDGSYWTTYVRDFLQIATRFDLLVRATLRNSAWVVAANPETLDLLQRLGRTDASLFSDSATSVPLTLPDREGDQDTTYRVLWAGKITGHKALPLFLDAIDNLPHCPDLQAIIVGEGELQEFCENRVKQLGLEDRVQFRGWLRLPEVYREMRRADVFVYSSLQDSGSLAMVEAMAQGLPCVAVNTGASGIIAADGRGILVEPTTPEQTARDLALAVMRLRNKTALCQEIRVKAYEYVKNTLSWEAMGKWATHVYGNVLENKEPVSR